MWPWHMCNWLGSLVILVLTSVSAQAMEGVLVANSVKSLPITVHDPIWNEALPVTLPLVGQNFVLPHGGGSVGQVAVQALATKTEMAFRLVWKDSTRNDTWDSSGRFTDGCAVQLPVGVSSIPSPFMGEKGNPVTLWRWRAIGQTPMEARSPKAYVDYYRPDAIPTVMPPLGPVEHLIAEGFGTVTPHPKPHLEGEGLFTADGWTVVLRGLRPTREVFPFAAAVWEGGASDRDGAKSLTFWHWVTVGGAKLSAPEKMEAKGQIVFSRYGCTTCHGPSGKGGVANSNSQTGPTIPPLMDLMDKFTQKELTDLIRQGVVPNRKDPKGPSPSHRMPVWKEMMDQEELKSLVGYLVTLKTKKKSKEEW